MLSRTVEQIGMPADGNVASLVNMVADYAYALDTLDRYDYQQLEISGTTSGGRFHATYDAAMDMIGTLRRKIRRRNALRQRERRLIQKLHRADIPDVRRGRAVSVG